MTAFDLSREQARRGLQQWSGFPADRQPRPLVLLFPAVRAGGFPDVDKKMAFLSGAIDAAPAFPATVLQALRTQRARTTYAGPPLTVTTATPASTKFCTDRGRLELPAWEVRATDVRESIWVLDPSLSEQAWQPPAPYVPDWPGSTAVLKADGRTVTMTFSGSPYADYPDAAIVEAGAAVAIVPTPVFIAPDTSASSAMQGGMPLVGQARRITISLARALDGRVLLDDSGSPVMVTT
ncbi:MAG: hypothetical protein LBV34_20860 [Nocardiopsaceae bacterium]|nr:hypothetical protein [Nocardiopsaceae bacterium]